MSKRKNISTIYPNTIQLLEKEVYDRRKRTQNMSQYALAEKAGITRNCIQQMECHEHIPKPETVLKIIRALGFNKAEEKEFMEKCVYALYHDSTQSEEREKEPAGVL